ncbi:uncharacterized protein LOC131879215 [Tigriopus californicus]|uniref:uncharacterized protein LOC131879215 n=1 Tax=Tigriopus californicus TaxID=6832 RepID=UPI0027DA27A9|nr:uncharacterized protein LOC131879215 [Tigriopus californicus]
MAENTPTSQASEEITLEVVVKWLALNPPASSGLQEPSEQEWNASNEAKSELVELERVHQRELDELEEKIRLVTLNGTSEVEDKKLKTSMEHLNAQEKNLASELKLLRSKIVELWIQRETEEDMKQELSNALELEEQSLKKMKENIQRDLNRFSELQTQLHDVKTSLELLPSLIGQSVTNNQNVEQTIFEAQGLLEGDMKTMSAMLSERMAQLQLKKVLIKPKHNMELEARKLAVEDGLNRSSLLESKLSGLSKYMEVMEKSDQVFEPLAEKLNSDIETCNALTEGRYLRRIPTQDANVQTEE